MAYSETLEKEILKKISVTENQDSLEKIRIAELGKKGKISLLMKDLSKLSPEDRKEQGSKLNILKKNISEAISLKKIELANIELEKQLLGFYLSDHPLKHLSGPAKLVSPVSVSELENTIAA